ncbi:hypothetical protein [Kitasatospora sp. NPDC089509]|uniref:hypothetical protein n=1 Tax=Kitasatospora sp. NPDC089509 TaxID=3364079 RepID=UPI0037FA99AB
MIYQLPLVEQPCFEFEGDLYTDQAAVSTVQLRHGLRGPIEVVARGTDGKVVRAAFEQALEQAAQLHTTAPETGGGHSPESDRRSAMAIWPNLMGPEQTAPAP